MSRVPFELARQAARLGCTVKYCREDKSFEFRLDGEVLAVVFPDGAYAGRADGTETAVQQAMLKKLRKAYGAVCEFLALYENGVEIDGISVFPDSRVLAFANGVYLLGIDLGLFRGFQFAALSRSSVSKFYPARKFHAAKREFLLRSGLGTKG